MYDSAFDAGIDAAQRYRQILLNQDSGSSRQRPRQNSSYPNAPVIPETPPPSAGKQLLTGAVIAAAVPAAIAVTRSEEHTSELQSHLNLVCRLLLEKKKKNPLHYHNTIKKKKTTPNM